MRLQTNHSVPRVESIKCKDKGDTYQGWPGLGKKVVKSAKPLGQIDDDHDDDGETWKKRRLGNVEENTGDDSEEEANGESDSHIEDDFDNFDGVR